MNAKLKFGIHQLAVKVHLGECSLNYIGRYNTKWCAGSDLITERPFLHTRSVISLHQRWPRVSGGNGNGRGEPNANGVFHSQSNLVSVPLAPLGQLFLERILSANFAGFICSNHIYGTYYNL